MPIHIEMPKLSDTMTEGTLLKWHKQIGDQIEIGDVIAEIETDKATMEMEAFDEGILTSILVQAGEKAELGAILGVLDGGDEGAPASAAPAPAQKAAPVAQAASCHVAKHSEPATAGDRVKASPLAKKVAAQQDVDLSQVIGTGPAGRILKADVEAAKTGKPSADAQAAQALASLSKAKSASSSSVDSSVTVQGIMPVMKDGDQRIELSSMRKIIASRLLTSKVTIPHFYLHVEADVAPLMALRKQINDQAAINNGNKYSVNDFILKAVVQALVAVPSVNASFAGDHMVQFKHVGLSVAIAVEDGLVTPVIKQAETKSLQQISLEVKDMAKRAKDRKLKPDEFDGGTITVSNLGAWGVDSFDAIVNPPQAAIISVGGAIEKPVVKNGQIVAGLRMNLGLSCDHRVVDGAVAAEFLGAIKKLIEQPALMLI